MTMSKPLRRYWPATLQAPPSDWKPKPPSRSREGWFAICYGEAESYGNEMMFVAVSPRDPTRYMAFREDAESLAGGVEFKFRGDAAQRLSTAVAALTEQEIPAPSLGIGSMEPDADIVGCRISLYWEGEWEWFSGTIMDFDEASSKHHVRLRSKPDSCCRPQCCISLIKRMCR